MVEESFVLISMASKTLFHHFLYIYTHAHRPYRVLKLKKDTKINTLSNTLQEIKRNNKIQFRKCMLSWTFLLQASWPVPPSHPPTKIPNYNSHLLFLLSDCRLLFSVSSSGFGGYE